MAQTSAMRRCKEGALLKKSDGILRDWKRYDFKLSQTYFHYFQAGRLKGQILSCRLTKVEIPVSKNTGSSSEKFPFTVHFSSKGAPWILSATSEEERAAWMEALIPGSTVHFGTDAARKSSTIPPLASSMSRENSKEESTTSLRLQSGSGIGEQGMPSETSKLQSSADSSTPQLAAVKESTPVTNPHCLEPVYHCLGPEYHCLEPGNDDKISYLEPITDSPRPYLEPFAPQNAVTRGPDPVPDGSLKRSPDVVPRGGAKSSSLYGSTYSTGPIAANQTEMLAQMLSRLNPGAKPVEEALATSSAQAPHLAKMLAESSNLEDSILPTKGDKSQPEWTRARTMTMSSLDGEQLSDLQKEALFISSSSLSDHVPIGKGQFGEVFKAILYKGTPGEVLVAVKTTKTNSTEKDKADFMKEMAVMSQILHPNIVRFYGLVNENQDSPSIVLEYLPNGDLKNFLKNPRPIKQLVKYMIDVAMGMHYISEKGLVHRDLAARNVLVGENEVCKVADFGLLRELPKEDSIYQSTANAPLPVRWMAPESIRERTFSVASDVWSYGILMWEMFNPGKVPYHTLSNVECVMEVASGTRLPLPASAPSIVARMMKSCWYKDPEKRPNFLVITTLLIAKGLTEACHESIT